MIAPRTRIPRTTHAAGLAAILLLGGSLASQLPDILLQERQVGDVRYLFVPLSYAADPGGQPTPSPITAADLTQLMAWVEGDLEAIAYSNPANLRVTNVAAPEITLPYSAEHYRAFGAHGQTSAEPRKQSHIEMRADARRLLRALPSPIDPDEFDRVIYIADGYGWGAGVWAARGQGMFNQRCAFLETSGRNRSSSYFVLHELGHTYGWRHTAMWAPECGLSGKVYERGDEFDIMGDGLAAGAGKFHWFHPWFLHRVGWLPDSSIRTVTRPGIYKLQPLEMSPSRLPSALKVEVGPNTNAWIFWRRYEGLVNRGGQGSWQNVAGPVIAFEHGSNFSRTMLIDAHPDPECPPVYQDAPMSPYQTFDVEAPGDPGTRFSIKYLAFRSAMLMTLRIDSLPPTPPPAPVIGRGHPQPAAGHVSGTFTYEATAYLPPGTSNGDGITKVEMRLFESSDATLRAMSGMPGVPPHPVPRMPICGTESQCFAAADFTPGSAHRPRFRLTVDTLANAPRIHNGGYLLVVKATGHNGESRVVAWPHIVYNPDHEPAVDGRRPKVRGGSPLPRR